MQITDKGYKGHRSLLESILKQLIKITDKYIYSDFWREVDENGISLLEKGFRCKKSKRFESILSNWTILVPLLKKGV
ncbi:hypothetical protein ABE47_17020 [Bacillus thuringiensis]|nr:hypothetical protein [Bacillus thuringiensis]